MNTEGTDGWTEEIPTLDLIELLSNGNVRVTTSDFQDEYSIDLHPMHLRLIAEKMGLVREMSASDADMLAAARRQHADAVRAVLTLKRRMLVLKDRIDHVGKSLVAAAEHADLDYELIHLTATAEICDEFCADLDDLVGIASNGVGVSPVTLDALPAAELSRVAPAGQAPDSSATTGPANPAETQRVVRKASAAAAPASGQQKDLLA